METAAAANVGLKAPSTLLCTPTLASPDPTGCRKRWGRGPSRTRSKEGLTYTELGLRTRPRRFSLARMEGRSEVRNPTKEKERDKKTQSLRGVRELSWEGRESRAEVTHSTTWTPVPRGRALQLRAQSGLRTRAGVQASLAQANILHSSGQRSWRTWVTGDVGSSPASSLRRQRGLRSSVLRGPVFPPKSLEFPCTRSLGPSAKRGAGRMNGSLWAQLHHGQTRLPRPPLTFQWGGGGRGGRGRRNGAGRASAVPLLFAPQHPDGEGGELGAARKTLKVTL